MQKLFNILNNWIPTYKLYSKQWLVILNYLGCGKAVKTRNMININRNDI